MRAERINASTHRWFLRRNPLTPDASTAMDEWIDYYDSTHTIYVSKLHRERHFAVIARDIVGYISSSDAVVLDYACGEALSAGSGGISAPGSNKLCAHPALRAVYTGKADRFSRRSARWRREAMEQCAGRCTVCSGQIGRAHV